MGEYVQHFERAGYDDLKVLCALNDSDLDAMGIDKPGTRKKFLIYAKELAEQNSKTTSTGKRNMPYRCTKCCQFKVRSLDGKPHRCDESLIGHSFDQCPTRNIRRHPEERKRRREMAEAMRSQPSSSSPSVLGQMPPLRHMATDHHSLLPLQEEPPPQHDLDSPHGTPHPDLVPLLPMKRHSEVADSSALPSWDAFREEEMARLKQACGDMLDPDKIPEYHLAIVRRYKELQDLHRKWKVQRTKAEEMPASSAQDMGMLSPLPMPTHDEHHRHPMEIDEASMRTLIPELSGH